MAGAFDYFSRMCDVSFKARRLETLIKECMPDQKHPVTDNSNVQQLLDEICTHRLLSEPELDESYEIDPKSTESWRRAVDLWIERLLALVSTNDPDKCWFGFSFLGLTCEACSYKRFEESYSLWFQKLLPHVQVPAASDIVKVAVCSSLSDMFTRLALGDFLDAKRDGVSFSGKLIQPLIKLLNESNSEEALAGAVHLICTILTYFPTSVYRHSDVIEAYIVTSLLSEKSSDKLRILAHCLAELPKSKGDEISWCSMMQKLLISINMNLKHVFQGLEEDSMCDKAIRGLVPPGMEHPPPLGGQKVSAETAESASKNLMFCCLKMLTSCYAVQVTVPVQPLLALIERVLMVDGSLAKSSFPFITVMQQESTCSQLPTLHEHCLDLLTALMRLVGSQLLPHISKIVRLLKEYFNRCALPKLRTKIYSNLQTMLTSMGSGLAVYISKDVIKIASADLDSNVSSTEGRFSNLLNLVSKEPLLVPCNRKRKHSAATESPDQQRNKVGFEVKAPTAASLSVMIAALEALEALLSAGGVSKDENLQSQVDHLLLTVANTACKGGWAKEVVNADSPNIHASTREEFQLASLKALKTSFISSTYVRPPHLAQGIELFIRGKLEVGTKIAKVCADALSSLEVLIHPRAQAVADFTSVGGNCVAESNYKLENVNSVYQKGNAMGMGLGELDPDKDSLYRSWLENEGEADIPTADSTKKENGVKQPLQNLECPWLENFTGLSDANGPSVDGGVQTAMAVDVGTEMTAKNADEVMLDRKQTQEPVLHEDPTSSGVPMVERLGTACQLANNDATVFQVANQTSALLRADDGFLAANAAASTMTGQMFELFKLDNTDDINSFPDIVDAEPDSDDSD